MNTSCSQYTAAAQTPPPARRIANTWFGLARAWWTRWMTSRKPRITESDLTMLDGLSAETLKDIGAPEWLQARAQRARDRARQGGLFERDSLHWR